MGWQLVAESFRTAPCRSPRFRAPNLKILGDSGLTIARHTNDDGTRCDPLTVNDVATRPKLEDVKLRLQDAFRDYGLLKQLLSDDGPPFAFNGLQRLSRLGMWLIRLGVEPTSSSLEKR